MAHEALVSLNLLIESFLNIGYRYTRSGTILVSSFYSRNSMVLRWNNILLPILNTAEVVQEEVWSLKSILELHHFKESESLIALKREILDAIPKFRGILQDLINKSQLLFSKYQCLDDESSDELEIIFQDLEEVRKEIISFDTMKKIIKEYNAKLDQETSNKDSPLADEDFGGNAKDTVGVYDKELQQLIDTMRRSDWFTIIPVVGMAGVGKTTIVKALYNDPVISYHFGTRAFVRVGPDYNLKDILLDLLVCLSPNYNKILGIDKSEDELVEQIHEFIIGRKYLIVFDDVWDIGFLNDMRIWHVLDENRDSYKSRIIITTRQLDLPNSSTIMGLKNAAHNIGLRNEEESWNLFCRMVFVPPGLEKVGKKIVKKCGGLPLGIISIANILSKAEKTLDYWEKVDKNENLLALVTEEGSHMSESLFLSYKHLPPHLKESCLYIGVFPLNHEISVSKLVKLWVGEGLVQPRRLKTFEDTARMYLEGLISHNIVLARQQSSSCRNKTCSAHYFFWHLLVREAANRKIFHLINSYPSAFSEDIHCQRRLCIHKNALLGLKHVSESIQSVSNVHSFLCTGPKHQYPVSICSGLTSIKVLDALTIRLYKFPIGILDLVELKDLAFTYDGKLPSSVSRLKNLVYLIVHRYNMTIINSSPSYMPIEIWNMQELRHLQVMGSDLPHPVDGAQLPNLLTLLGVSDRSCTKEVLQSIPNLKKLGVRIILPQGVSKNMYIFDHLALLFSLKSFKCIVSNPNPRSWQVLFLSKSVFPSSLTKLSLSGCGFAWKDMSIIGALPNLRVLKLRCYAFQGPEWVTDDGEEFPKLKYMLLEDTDLVHWKVGNKCFPMLKHLIIRRCYKLRKIIIDYGVDCFLQLESLIIHHCYEFDKNLEWVVCLMSLVKIEFVDCSPDSIASAKKIQQLLEEIGMVGIKLGYMLYGNKMNI